MSVDDQTSGDGDAAPAFDSAKDPLVDLVAGCVLAASALLALFWLIPAHTQPALSEFDVAPGFFPNMAAGAVLALSTVLIIVRFRTLRQAMVSGDRTFILVDIAIWSFVGLATIGGMQTIGFVWTAPVLIAAGMVFSGCRTLWLIAVLAIAFPVIVDFAAWHIFTVELP